MKISTKNLQKNRILIFTILLAMLIILCVYYLDNYKPYKHSPSNTDNIFYTSGTVTKIFNGGFYLQESSKVTIKVITTQNVSAGDQVAVKGTLTPQNYLNPSKIIVTPVWSFQLVLFRSFLALLVFLFFFNRYWKFDFKEKIFKRRK